MEDGGEEKGTVSLTTNIFRQSLGDPLTGRLLCATFVVLTSPCLNTPLQLIHLLLKLTLMKMSTTDS